MERIDGGVSLQIRRGGALAQGSRCATGARSGSELALTADAISERAARSVSCAVEAIGIVPEPVTPQSPTQLQGPLSSCSSCPADPWAAVADASDAMSIPDIEDPATCAP